MTTVLLLALFADCVISSVRIHRAGKKVPLAFSVGAVSTLIGIPIWLFCPTAGPGLLALLLIANLVLGLATLCNLITAKQKT